jgi:hypothetical protein
VRTHYQCVHTALHVIDTTTRRDNDYGS